MKSPYLPWRVNPISKIETANIKIKNLFPIHLKLYQTNNLNQSLKFGASFTRGGIASTLLMKLSRSEYQGLEKVLKSCEQCI